MYDMTSLNKYDQNHRMVTRAQQRIENITRHYADQLQKLEERYDSVDLTPRQIDNYTEQKYKLIGMRAKKIHEVVESVVTFFEESPCCAECGKALPVSSISSGAKVCSTCYKHKKGVDTSGDTETEGSPFYVCTLYGAEGEKIADYGSTERQRAVAAMARASLVSLVYGLPEKNPVRYLVVALNLRSLIDEETSWEYQGLRVTIEEKRIN